MSATLDPGPPTGSIQALEPSLTEHIADFLTETRPSDLPAETIEEAKYFLLDWLSSAIAGTATRAGAILLAHAAEESGRHSTVIGLSGKKSPRTAAFTNGALGHITETDDVHRAAVLHPAVVAIPPALAVAERLAARGIDLLTAVVLGYEVAIRVGEAVGTSHYRYWHNTSTCGTFGATAAAGWLLGLSRQQMVWALGNAGSLSSGLWEFNEDGSMAKHLHAGHAASSGVLVAELAARDFTGTRRILEGRRGLFAATSADARPDLVTAGLHRGMQRYKISECVIKPYPSCRHTHAPVDLALDLHRSEDLHPAEISRIEVDSYQATLDLTDNPNPSHEYAAKFSVQYCVAAALALGRLSLQDFGHGRLWDPTIRRLMSLTRVRVDPAIQARYPAEWCCRLTVTTSTGKSYQRFTSAPRGDPENRLSLEDLQEKFRSLLKGTRFEGRSEELIQRVAHLDSLEDARLLLSEP